MSHIFRLTVKDVFCRLHVLCIYVILLYTPQCTDQQQYSNSSTSRGDEKNRMHIIYILPPLVASTLLSGESHCGDSVWLVGRWVGGGRVVARRKNNDQTPTPAVASRMHAKGRARNNTFINLTGCIIENDSHTYLAHANLLLRSPPPPFELYLSLTHHK